MEGKSVPVKLCIKCYTIPNKCGNIWQTVIKQKSRFWTKRGRAMRPLRVWRNLLLRRKITRSRAPSSRAWSLPPAVREAGKRNAEGLARRSRDWGSQVGAQCAPFIGICANWDFLIYCDTKKAAQGRLKKINFFRPKFPARIAECWSAFCGWARG